MSVKKLPEVVDRSTDSNMLWDEINDKLTVTHDGDLLALTDTPGISVEFHSLDATGGIVLLQKSRSTKNAPTTCIDGDSPGFISFQAYNGTAYNSNATIVATITGPIGAVAFPTELALTTNDGATGFTTKRLTLSASGNVSIGTGILNTKATDGFLYITSCAGEPSGIPTTITDRVPLVVDTKNRNLTMYLDGAWRDVSRPRTVEVPTFLVEKLEYPDELNLLIYLGNHNDFKG